MEFMADRAPGLIEAVLTRPFEFFLLKAKSSFSGNNVTVALVTGVIDPWCLVCERYPILIANCTAGGELSCRLQAPIDSHRPNEEDRIWRSDILIEARMAYLHQRKTCSVSS